MQPRSLPSLNNVTEKPGIPDEHDVRRQIALSLYIYKELRGLDVNSVPTKWDLDKETQNYYRDLVKQRRGNRPPTVWDLFKPPFWLPESTTEL